MKSAYYISSSQTYSSMVEEDAFISYAIAPHTFNQAAIVTIELADSDGSTMRKYDVDTNAVYVGPGAVEIWEPDASCVFMGRIIKARHNEKGNRVTLLCQDWMSILGEERIKYEMREDIDGYGSRQSTVRTHIDGSVKKPVARLMKAGVSDDGGVYNDETTQTNSDTIDDMTLLPVAGVVDDGYLFGFNTGDKTELTVNVSTAGVGTWSIYWYYSTGQGTWDNLPGVTDPTTGFKTAGINTVTWSSAPGDWAEATYDGKTAYWVRGYIGWVTVYTSAPKGAWAHGDYFMYDDAMSEIWAADDWDGKFVVFPNEAAGSISISTGPRSETTYALGAGDPDTDEPVDGETAVWYDDEKYHRIADNGHDYFHVDYRFFLPIELSKLFIRGLTGARIHCEYSLEGAVDPATEWNTNRIWMTDRDTLHIHEIAKLEVDEPAGDVSIRKVTWEIPEQYLDNVLSDDDGECQITLIAEVDTVTPTTATLKVHKIRLEVDVVLQGYAEAVEIFDTQVESAGASKTFYSVTSGISAYFSTQWWYDNKTTEVNNATENDFRLIDNQLGFFGPAAFYFGSNSTDRGGIKLIVGIASSPRWPAETTWQYSLGSGVWKDFVSIAWTRFAGGGFDLYQTGLLYVSWYNPPDDWATDTVDGVSGLYWVRAYTPVTHPIPVTDCWGTQAWFIDYGTGTTTTKLLVDRDLTEDGVGIYEGCPYSIVSPINTHINGLVTGGDDLMTLTTNVESTTGISTRHYDDRTRLEIMLDLGKMDSAVCWIPLGTKEVQWKSTFAGSTTNLTDSDVLAWDGGEYDYVPMFNEYHIGGIQIGDNKLYTETEDMLLLSDPGADSKTKYGASRTKVISSTGTTTQHDTQALGTALVEANEDVHLFLECVIAGLPSDYRLGDEINVTSSYLGLADAKYVVTSFSYNSKAWRTKLTLHPRTSSGFIDRTPFGEHLRRIGEQSRESMIDAFVPDLTTHRIDG